MSWKLASCLKERTTTLIMKQRAKITTVVDRSEQNANQLREKEEAENKFVNGDRFHNWGEEMIKDAALTSVHLLRNLPAGEAENFAVALWDTVAELIAKQQVHAAQQAQAPLELPDPLPKSNICAFSSNWKRAMTGCRAGGDWHCACPSKAATPPTQYMCGAVTQTLGCGPIRSL